MGAGSQQAAAWQVRRHWHCAEAERLTAPGEWHLRGRSPLAAPDPAGKCNCFRDAQKPCCNIFLRHAVIDVKLRYCMTVDSLVGDSKLHANVCTCFWCAHA